VALGLRGAGPSGHPAQSRGRHAGQSIRTGETFFGPVRSGRGGFSLQLRVGLAARAKIREAVEAPQLDGHVFID
jgi:hypothetical protein